MALDGKNAITRALERNPEATLLALTKGAKPLPIESLERPYSPKTGEFHTPPECNLYVEVAQLLAGPDHGGAQLRRAVVRLQISRSPVRVLIEVPPKKQFAQGGEGCHLCPLGLLVTRKRPQQQKLRGTSCALIGRCWALVSKYPLVTRSDRATFYQQRLICTSTHK
jgi:hypothetical protein